MIGITVTFIAGIAAANFFPFFPFSIVLLSTVAAIFLFLRESKKQTLFVFLFLISGFVYGLIRQEAIPEIKFPDGEVFVEGTVIEVPEILEGKLRFVADKVVVEGKSVQGRVLLVILPELFGNDIKVDLLVPGDRISVIAILNEPGTFRNPGVYSHDLRKDGIIAAGYIKQVKLIGRSSDSFLIYTQRQKLGMIMDRSLSKENASFHKAIIPGLKKGINQNMRDSFSYTGLAHLLSISGTHFGLLAFIIFQLIRTVIKYLPARVLTGMTLYITPSQVAVLSTLPVLVLYALISGASTPTVRALIMIFIYMLALFLGRKGQWLNSLAIAGFIILLWQPSALFELSFQLSFVAVLSIGYVLEKNAPSVSSLTNGGIKRGIWGIKGVREKVKTALLITIAAVFGTAPIVAIAFKQFPLISPVTNLIVTPLVCFVILPLGFFACFGALLLNMHSLPLNAQIDAITFFALRLIEIFSQIPYAALHVHNPTFIMIVLYYISLVFTLRSSSKWRYLPLILVICIYLINPYFTDNKLKVTFLDVGQGDASVVTLPDKKVLVVDGGIDKPDTGRRVIGPYLWSKGIKKVDYLIVSHPHPDHYGGLSYILENFAIGEVWLNGRMTYESWIFFQKIVAEKVPYRVLRRGDILDSAGYKIYVFHPYDDFYANSPRGGFSEENSDSLVFKIESGDSSILFTGDIEAEAEENLIYLGDWLKSDIIKVPHHGSRTSSSSEFIKTVSPQIAVISAGKNNIFTHPHRETLERYEHAGVKLYRTDINGAVEIAVRDNFYEIKTYRDSRLKKVARLQDEIRNLKLLF
jgi:competence protein ComEC